MVIFISNFIIDGHDYSLSTYSNRLFRKQIRLSDGSIVSITKNENFLQYIFCINMLMRAYNFNKNENEKFHSDILQI